MIVAWLLLASAASMASTAAIDGEDAAASYLCSKQMRELAGFKSVNECLESYYGPETRQGDQGIVENEVPDHRIRFKEMVLDRLNRRRRSPRRRDDSSSSSEEDSSEEKGKGKSSEEETTVKPQ